MKPKSYIEIYSDMDDLDLAKEYFQMRNSMYWRGDTSALVAVMAVRFFEGMKTRVMEEYF